MENKQTKKERESRFARIWVISRTNAGKTQEYMASQLGVSKKTIQNWEKGVTAPDFFMGSEWFRVLGVNPLPYYLSFVFPNLFDGIAPEDSDDVIDQALMVFLRDMTITEKRELLYLIAGKHGSPWYSLLQLFTAHCHTSLKSRVNAARVILDSYEMEEKTGDLVCMDNIKPDIQILRNAIEEGKRSVMEGSRGYTNVESFRD